MTLRRRKSPRDDEAAPDDRPLAAAKEETQGLLQNGSSTEGTAPTCPSETATRTSSNTGVKEKKKEEIKPTTATTKATPPLYPSTYYVAKWMILRLLGLVYFVAFLGAYHQNEGLMGRFGLQPTSMEGLFESYSNSSRWQGFLDHPTLFWWIPLTDETMHQVIVTGMLLSALVMCGVNSWLLQLLLWLLDFSIVTIAAGNSFYAYGWESQILETGFLAIFLCTLPSIEWKTGHTGRLRFRLALWEKRNYTTNNNNNNNRPSPIILWLFRWLCFRISIGAGLIKIRGSSCWTQKTCLHYHFETQPIPSPLSFVFHFFPRLIQSHMVDVDLWVQVYTSALVLIPLEWISSSRHFLYRWMRNLLRAGGVIQAGFMVAIILSGNFAFLNHLTIIPALACLDDDFVWQSLRSFVKGSGGGDSGVVANEKTTLQSDLVSWQRPSRRWLDLALFLWIGVLSWPVIANLLQLKGSRQLMNASFGSFRLVNTYGAFGSVGQARYEAIVSVSDGLDSSNSNSDGENVELDPYGIPLKTNWTELEFPCKPGNIQRRPCFCAPYHYRADWNIWFLGFKPHHGMLRRREGWLYALLVKLVVRPGVSDDETTMMEPQPWLALFDHSTAQYLRNQYYQHGKAPKYVKVDMWHYQMRKSLWALMGDWYHGRDVVWWKRRYEESLISPVTWDDRSQRLQFVKRQQH